MTAILDTSALLAALDSAAKEHERCREAIETTPGPLIVLPMVLAEMDYLLAYKGHDRVMPTIVIPDIAGGAYTLADVSIDDLTKAAAVMSRYADLKIGLTDAVAVVLADRHRTAQVITLDERHFRVVRPLRGRRAFTVIPSDSSDEP